MTSHKSSQKPVKSRKSNKNERDSIMEFSCKFRGKYDLNKNMKNNELSLENAVNLCEVIHLKNESLFKTTQLRMDSNKKIFTFKDKNSITKPHHHVPYEQVKKFFVLHKDPTMIIMGVVHKNQHLFLVFQFKDTKDLEMFCDEIEGNKVKTDGNGIPENTVENDDYPIITEAEVVQMRTDSPLDTSNNIERISVHSKVYNENLMVDNIDFFDSYYEPDLEPETFALESSREETAASPRISSRSSDENNLEEKSHCDNIGQSKIKDLFISPGHIIYDDYDDWDENIIFMDDLNNETNQKGSFYIYCARHKVSYMPSEFNDNANEKFKNNFHNHEPKIIIDTKENDNFQNHKPKIIEKAINLNNPTDYDPKMSQYSNDMDINNFQNHEPKMIQNEKDLENFENSYPQIMVKTKENDKFLNHGPRVINWNNGSDNFHNHEPKVINMNSGPDNIHNHEPNVIKRNGGSDNFHNHEPKML